jgi:glycosyltransferase involved in cell wall biosynthesis
MTPIISVIIPAYNEENSIGRVLNDLPKEKLKEIIVVNNASTDNTAEVARINGATVVEERCRGYGAACLRGISVVSDSDIVVFVDGDYSDYPEELDQLIKPITENRADFVLGSRMIYPESREALLPQARYGNKLATFLIYIFFGYRFTDLGPFRAIRFDSLKQINMVDTDFGWTVEMQIKAIKNNLRIEEIPVHYRKRIGISKITGTISGTFKAGVKIMYTIFKYLLV